LVLGSLITKAEDARSRVSALLAFRVVILLRQPSFGLLGWEDALPQRGEGVWRFRCWDYCIPDYGLGEAHRFRPGLLCSRRIGCEDIDEELLRVPVEEG